MRRNGKSNGEKINVVYSRKTRRARAGVRTADQGEILDCFDHWSLTFDL